MNNRQELAAEIAKTCAVFAALFTLGVIGISFIAELGREFELSSETMMCYGYILVTLLGAIPIVLDALLKTQHKL